jgi:hypothetical protein
MMESESQYCQQMSTKRHNSSSAEQEKGKESAAAMSVFEGSNKENWAMGEGNFKKLRKEISRKIEVNIEERAKEGKPKFAQNRKQSNSSKTLKGKLRDESL